MLAFVCRVRGLSESIFYYERSSRDTRMSDENTMKARWCRYVRNSN